MAKLSISNISKSIAAFPKPVLNVLKIPKVDTRNQQLRVLKKLLKKAQYTEFGQTYKFDEILMSKHIGKKYQQMLPIFDYQTIFEQWWKKSMDGVRDVAWPGKIPYYALSSGTSDAATKYIPITNDMLKSNTINMARQYLSLTEYDKIPAKSIGKSMLMIGGTTELRKGPTGYLAGDISGIMARKKPFWFDSFYKPGKEIAAIKDWNEKLERIVEEAPNWDIGFVVGVPAWLQLIMEKVIAKYNLKNIHDIWPNFGFLIHGGVAFEPYKKGFEKLLGKPIVYIENYLSSEGFIAYKDRQYADGLKLVTDVNMFFEFVPFNDNNFDADGNIKPSAEALMLHEIELEKQYAILLTTNAGNYRYLIGDTIKLVNKERNEILITGRTKHFLSLVGEHLSVDNMNNAIKNVSEKLNIEIPEFCVAGKPFESFFAHHWHIACNTKIDVPQFKTMLDEALCLLNEDYEVERKSALKEIFVNVHTEQTFTDFLASKGKSGGQHKFPRVIKGAMLADWEAFVGQ
jgi:hypothetical protein